MNGFPKVFLIIGSTFLVLVFLIVTRFYIGTNKAKNVNAGLANHRIQLPPVEHLEVIPLIDSQTNYPELKTEDGVSYLVKIARDTILFDVGYNKKDEKISPLLYNMKKMHLSLDQVNSIVISHAHVDHCGGIAVVKEKRVKLASRPVDLKGKDLYVPVPLSCETGNLIIVNKPQLLGNNIASTGPLRIQMFVPGRLYEQSLLINVKNKGLVVIIGCGHPGIQSIIKFATEVTGIPVYAVVGGAHLYYTKVQDLFFRNLFGSSKFFSRSMTKEEVVATAEYLKKAGVSKVYLSPHDSDEASRKIFAAKFDENYQMVQVGQKIEF